MQTLYVYRHAKAVTWTPGCEDFARRLQPIGEQHAEKVADWLVSNRALPGSILCSPSQRTRETLAPLIHLEPSLSGVTHFLPQLYLANLKTLETALDAAFANSGSVMIVGHNPGLEVLVSHSVNASCRQDFYRLPTGTLAVIDLESGWPDDQGKGRLSHLIRGKHL